MVPVQRNAEPFSATGGPVGVVLVHGFTGSPASMRPWGEHLAAEGLTVSVPRLPGHGTTWQEMNQTTWRDWYAEASRALTTLKSDCESVFVAGLSMGGCLSLRLAADRPHDVAGLILVNPSITSTDKRLLATPVLKHLLGSVPGIGNDIKKQGTDEYGYTRVPLRALDSMREMWRLTRDELPKVTAPMVVFRSVEDHVVEPLSTQLITQRVSSRDVSERVLDNSYHVATLDNDAETIFTESVEFIAKHTPTSPGGQNAV
jgi:carboxylesterase